MTTTEHVTPEAATARSLVVLLGEQRAAIVEHLRRTGEASVAQLAELLHVSQVATRRHLAVLSEGGFVAAHTVNDGVRGRPASRYRLTDAAHRLFPQGYDRLASEVMDFLADEHGRDGLRAFLRWRLDREVSGLRGAVTAEDLHDRLDQLAAALSDAGFEASVTPDGDGFTLTQDHCAIYDVAKEHPEVCAYEAATFSQVLGRDVKLSRRETMAGGSSACVCCVAALPPDGDAPSGERRTDPEPTSHRTDRASETSMSPPGRGDDL